MSELLCTKTDYLLDIIELPMNYKDKSDLSDKKVLNSLIATKIRDLMEKLRLESTESDQRRWVWELLQNAKDVAYDGETVQIEIELTESQKLIFRHTGQPFSIDNITFLIKQASSKERDLPVDGKNKPTGKFGTGFLTTHLLSEKVQVSGVVKEPELNYRSFILPLDRSGRNSDDIIVSVNKSVAIRDALDGNEPLLTYNRNDFNTSFEYILGDDGLDVAKKGIEDLGISLPYTLAFVPTINHVKISSPKISFELNGVDELNSKIKIYKIKHTLNETSEIINILKIEDNETSIAIEVERKEEKIYIKKFSENLPKIFCDFPLVGTENFTLPFVVNSPLFNPTEPRDGVWLSDKAEPKIVQNKKIFLDAIGLYSELMDFAVENKWENLHLLTTTGTPSDKKWFSKTWFEENIQMPIRNKLLNLPIVTLEDGTKASILDEKGEANIFFPYHSKKDVRERIWNLRYKIIPNNIPAKKHIHYWYELVWQDSSKDNMKALTAYIHDLNSLASLAELVIDPLRPIDWLNEYYDLLNFEGKFIEEIIAGKYAVIPNQKGDFKRRVDLKIDEGIDEELKNVLEILNVDTREGLRHNEITTASKYKDRKDTEGQILYKIENQEEVINKINQLLESGKNENSEKATSHLISLFNDGDSFPESREILYQFCVDLLPEETPQKKKIHNWSNDIWRNCDSSRIRRLISIISEAQDTCTLSTVLKIESIDSTSKWLNSFISFLKNHGYSELLNLEDNPILPNQKNTFCQKDNLFIERGNIDIDLKNILDDLGSPIKEELLNEQIYLELPQSRERNEEYVADEITRFITSRFSEIPRSEETKEIFSSLFLWFNNNQEKAEELFQNLYTNKHKLYDDDKIAENLEKARILTDIEKETGLSANQIKERLIKLLSKANATYNGPVNYEELNLMDLYPVGSEDDISTSTSLIDNSSEKSRISISEEAKLMIFQSLRNKGFQISNNVNTEYTVTTGIVSPTGKTVKIVIKSARTGKIYFNPNEWLALSEPDSQLFVVTRGDVVRNITLSDIEAVNETFHMRFNTLAFAMTNVKAFANFFQYLPYTHFIFDSPESTSDYLEQFGLNERITNLSELSADDKSLLH
ncbi:sacsin N-terminal ATP-binding-like domain-containing protein [Gillisia sp. Q332]|uniref:sacsin N-terminal ATP-binding-like domain-containing protein n=1 Tax=Gillisia xinjiangensis TaxID=3384765 RepID=UPI00391E0105